MEVALEVRHISPVIDAALLLLKLRVDLMVAELTVTEGKHDHNFRDHRLLMEFFLELVAQLG